MKINEKGTEKRTICPTCDGFAVRLCPWCKIDVKDDKGNVIRSKPGQGCRACLGAGIFTCTQCEGKGFLPQDEIEIPGTHDKSGVGYMRE